MAGRVFTAEEIAEVCHEANRVLRLAFEDSGENPHWAEANIEQQESVVTGVWDVLLGNTPEQSHENWLKFKEERGWVYGEVKDEDAKTHPCFVPYADLPADQKVKDALFVAIVKALADVVDAA